MSEETSLLCAFDDAQCVLRVHEKQLELKLLHVFERQTFGVQYLRLLLLLACIEKSTEATRQRCSLVLYSC
jgi:hypothetical protein